MKMTDGAFSFASLLLNEEGLLEPDYEDEILKASLVARDGVVTFAGPRS